MTPVSKRLAIALFISVALNLLFVGFVLGRRMKHGHGPRGEAGELGDREKRPRHPLLREALDRHRDDFSARRAAVMQARKGVAVAAEHEPFDRGALERALADLRRESSASQETLHRALVEACESAPPEKRRALAAQFLKSPAAREP